MRLNVLRIRIDCFFESSGIDEGPRIRHGTTYFRTPNAQVNPRCAARVDDQFTPNRPAAHVGLNRLLGMVDAHRLSVMWPETIVHTGVLMRQDAVETGWGDEPLTSDRSHKRDRQVLLISRATEARMACLQSSVPHQASHRWYGRRCGKSCPTGTYTAATLDSAGNR